MGGYQKQAAMSEVEGEASRAAERKKAAASFGLLGLVLGVGLGLIGGWVGRLAAGRPRGAVGGGLAGAAAGAGLSWAAVPLFFRYQDPESGLDGPGHDACGDLHRDRWRHRGWASAWAWATRSSIGRALFGGLLGGFLGTIALETVNLPGVPPDAHLRADRVRVDSRAW